MKLEAWMHVNDLADGTVYTYNRNVGAEMTPVFIITVDDYNARTKQRAILRRVVNKLSDVSGIDLSELYEEYSGLEHAMEGE